MRDRPRTGRRVLVVVLVVLTCTLPVVALSEPRPRPADTSPPVTVYASETLDISDVTLTSDRDEEIGDDPVTLRAVDGEASFVVDDPTNANFTGADPGLYYVVEDDDQRPELRVVEPRVTSLVLRNGRGETVTNRTVRSLDSLIIRAEYDFDEADRLDVTVGGPDGEPLNLNPRSARITESGERTSVYMADRPPGTYTVTVRGSDIVDGQRSATVTVRGEGTATATPSPTPTPTETPTATATASPTSTTPSPTPTEAPADGFGVVVAAVAVLGALVAARIRR